MRAITYIVALIATAYMLGGCSTPVPPSRLEHPSARLLAEPEALPDLAKGDDLVQKHAALRRSYAIETSKLTRLQRYVRRVLRK